MRVRWIESLALVWSACSAGAPPVPAESDLTQVEVAPLGAPHRPVATSELGPEDAAYVAAVTPLVAQAKAARLRCGVLFDAAPASDGNAAALSFDEAQLNTACGEVGGLYDRFAPTLAGRERSTDVLFSHLARVADDLDYLRRTFATTPAEQRNAHHHVQDALIELDRGLADWEGSLHRSYSADARMGAAGQWARDLANDKAGVPGVRDAFDHLAFNQGSDPKRVRRRMLESFLRVQRLPTTARSAGLDGEPAGPERTARRVYLAACTAAIDAHAHVLAQYLAGAVPGPQERAALIAESDAALATWRAAWETETARTTHNK